VIILALCAYLNVLNVSLALIEAGDMVAIMRVRAFPANDSRSSHVNTESRKGMARLLLEPFPFFTNAEMHRPKALRLKFLVCDHLNNNNIKYQVREREREK
jgi:hypothetical protein